MSFIYDAGSTVVKRPPCRNHGYADCYQGRCSYWNSCQGYHFSDCHDLFRIGRILIWPSPITSEIFYLQFRSNPYLWVMGKTNHLDHKLRWEILHSVVCSTYVKSIWKRGTSVGLYVFKGRLTTFRTLVLY